MHRVRRPAASDDSKVENSHHVGIAKGDTSVVKNRVRIVRLSACGNSTPRNIEVTFGTAYHREMIGQAIAFGLR